MMDSERDVIILIVGLTGVGKSNFINAAAGSTVLPIGHDLQSFTAKVQPVVVPYPGDPTRRVVFVDTPGFNDTWARDKQILTDIINWLASSCHGIKLAGVLYMNDISQARIEPARENLRMFNTLCHPPAFQNVILATTKWGNIPAHVGQPRERQLSEQYWTGTGVHRFDNTYESAWAIVDVILEKIPVDAALFHQELDDLQRRLSPRAQAGIAGGFFKFLFGRRGVASGSD